MQRRNVPPWRCCAVKAERKTRFLKAVRTVLSLLFNPHFMLCYGLAWLITNGWAYIFTVLGTYFDLGWMAAIGSGYLALIWTPFTPEKFITVAIAILLLRRLFPGDQKTLAILRMLQQKAKEQWESAKQRRRERKEQQKQSE